MYKEVQAYLNLKLSYLVFLRTIISEHADDVRALVFRAWGGLESCIIFWTFQAVLSINILGSGRYQAFANWSEAWARHITRAHYH